MRQSPIQAFPPVPFDKLQEGIREANFKDPIRTPAPIDLWRLEPILFQDNGPAVSIDGLLGGVTAISFKALIIPKSVTPAFSAWSGTDMGEVDRSDVGYPMLVKIGAKVVAHGRYVTFQLGAPVCDWIRRGKRFVLPSSPP